MKCEKCKVKDIFDPKNVWDKGEWKGKILCWDCYVWEIYHNNESFEFTEKMRKELGFTKKQMINHILTTTLPAVIREYDFQKEMM